MAGTPIATLNDLIAGIFLGDNLRLYKVAPSSNEAAGVWACYFDRGGSPAAMSKPAVGINGAVQSKSVLGYINYRNPTGGRKKYLASATIQANQGGILLLADVLWHNWTSTSGIVPTTLTEQAITTPALPARDTNQAVNGEGCEIWLGVLSTAATNASAIVSTTVRYTNSNGEANRVATLPSWPATAVANTMVPLVLQAGDTGVESIEGITLGTSYGAGELVLAIVRPIAALGITASNTGLNFNFADLGMPQIFDDSALAPFLLCSSTTGAPLSLNLRMAEW